MSLENNAKEYQEISYGYMKKWPMVELEAYLIRIDKRNKDNRIKDVKGLSVTKQFREPTSKVDKENLSSYKIVGRKEFSFVQTTNNEKCLVVCLSQYENPIVVSSVNEVFKISDFKNCFLNIFSCNSSVRSLTVMQDLIPGVVLERHLLGRTCVG